MEYMISGWFTDVFDQFYEIPRSMVQSLLDVFIYLFIFLVLEEKERVVF
jgi:hypothetical protein